MYENNLFTKPKMGAVLQKQLLLRNLNIDNRGVRNFTDCEWKTVWMDAVVHLEWSYAKISDNNLSTS